MRRTIRFDSLLILVSRRTIYLGSALQSLAPVFDRNRSNEVEKASQKPYRGVEFSLGTKEVLGE
jgi:hypothetical protein